MFLTLLTFSFKWFVDPKKYIFLQQNCNFAIRIHVPTSTHQKYLIILMLTEIRIYEFYVGLRRLWK